MKGNKGFTLIEIIICIVLISIIGTGTTFAVITTNNKKENNILVENSDDFENALNIYLSSHGEILDNLYNSVEGAVVSLELLKNEGLISDNLNIDYEDNYFLLSDAVLLQDGNGDDECNGRVSIQTIKSWDLSKYDSSDVLYVCPKSSSGGGVIINNITYVTEGQIQTTTSNVLTNGYFANGENPNNWVKFDVNSDDSKWVYFSNDSDINLWRILSISSDGKIKLVYNKEIQTNWSISPNIDKTTCYGSSTVYCKPVGAYTSSYDKWYRIDGETGLTQLDIFSYGFDKENSAKNYIYNSIVKKDWLSKERYYSYAEFPDEAVNASLGLYIYLQSEATYYEDYIGHLSLNEYRATVNPLNKTFLKQQVVAYTYYLFNSSKEYFVITGENQANLDIANSVSYKDSGKYIYYLNTYYPVVTLDSKIKIKSYDNCDNGTVRGSKECPFELIET